MAAAFCTCGLNDLWVDVNLKINLERGYSSYEINEKNHRNGSRFLDDFFNWDFIVSAHI